MRGKEDRRKHAEDIHLEEENERIRKGDKEN